MMKHNTTCGNFEALLHVPLLPVLCFRFLVCLSLLIVVG